MNPPVEEIDFGFFFCRVMAFYHLAPREVLGLLTKTFWLMNGNIDRIEAQRDMRSLSLACASQSSEAATQHRERLELEVGDIVVAPQRALDPERDERGFQDLKAMAGEVIGGPRMTTNR